jgi:hypothetical protein
MIKMRFNSNIVLTLTIILGVNSALGYKQKLNVYFEALCPDSKRFLTYQLPVVINEFGRVVNDLYESDQIEINLIAFGKANVTDFQNNYPSKNLNELGFNLNDYIY